MTPPATNTTAWTSSRATVELPAGEVATSTWVPFTTALHLLTPVFHTLSLVLHPLASVRSLVSATL